MAHNYYNLQIVSFSPFVMPQNDLVVSVSRSQISYCVLLFPSKVMWVLRATKAFKHLFPTEMEREVAKVVGYERYV